MRCSVGCRSCTERPSLCLHRFRGNTCFSPFPWTSGTSLRVTITGRSIRGSSPDCVLRTACSSVIITCKFTPSIQASVRNCTTSCPLGGVNLLPAWNFHYIFASSLLSISRTTVTTSFGIRETRSKSKPLEHRPLRDGGVQSDLFHLLCA